ncbi:MAG: ATP-dependent DNA ligase, partial [Actinomycetota bacterium]|nr:ATP-dependent DNA ligase [Actinomycetota bacterium]
MAPPVAPMLARLARDLPVGPDWAYEPKWDGFRCLVFRDGDAVDLRSRHDRPLGRYFPEVVAAVRELPDPQLVLDGELVVHAASRASFPDLMARLHPAASRVATLAALTPAAYVAFDVLAAAGRSRLATPYRDRRTA